MHTSGAIWSWRLYRVSIIDAFLVQFALLERRILLLDLGTTRAATANHSSTCSPSEIPSSCFLRSIDELHPELRFASTLLIQLFQRNTRWCMKCAVNLRMKSWHLLLENGIRSMHFPRTLYRNWYVPGGVGAKRMIVFLVYLFL